MYVLRAIPPLGKSNNNSHNYECTVPIRGPLQLIVRIACFSHHLRINISFACSLITPLLRPLLPQQHISLQRSPRCRCSPRNRLLRSTRRLGLQLVQTLPLGQDAASRLQLGLLGLGVIAQVNGLGLREEGRGEGKEIRSMVLAWPGRGGGEGERR